MENRRIPVVIKGVSEFLVQVSDWPSPPLTVGCDCSDLINVINDVDYNLFELSSLVE